MTLLNKQHDPLTYTMDKKNVHSYLEKSAYHWHGVDVENDEMKRHGQKNCSDEKWVLSWGHDEERLVLRNRVQGVEHFDCDLNFSYNKEKLV